LTQPTANSSPKSKKQSETQSKNFCEKLQTNSRLLLRDCPDFCWLAGIFGDVLGCFGLIWAYLGLFGLFLDVSCNQVKPCFKKPTQSTK
jgi:hypothetical protein